MMHPSLQSRPRPIPSKVPNINDSILRIMNLLGEFSRLEKSLKDKDQTVTKRLQELDAAIARVTTLSQGKKGEPGKTPRVDYNVLATVLKKHLKTPEDGKDAVVDYEKIISGVVARMPKPKVNTPAVDHGYIIEEVSKKVKAPEIDPMSIIDMIMKLPKGKGLATKHIDGLEQTMQAYKNQLGRGYLHGGGDTIRAGTGISIGVNTDGTKTINSTGGTTIYSDTLIGTINGSNKVFTVANIITSALALYLANSIYQPVVDFTVTDSQQITFVTAPDSSLSGQPFWLSHT